MTGKAKMPLAEYFAPILNLMGVGGQKYQAGPVFEQKTADNVMLVDELAYAKGSK